MRIVAWNLAHQTVERPIPAAFGGCVGVLRPDLLVLSEYVHGPTRRALLETLAGLGLEHVLVSQRRPTANQNPPNQAFAGL